MILFHFLKNVKLYEWFLTISLYIDTTEDILRDVFGKFGAVTDVYLPRDRNTNRPRGFGFVTMANRAGADDAIAQMDNTQLDGRTIRVNEGRPKGQGPDGGRGFGPGGRSGFNAEGKEDVKLYVGSLSFETTEDMVREHFQKYGEIKDCFLPTDRNTGKVRGFAFVTMAAADAQKACEDSDAAELDGRTLTVNEAQPKGARGGPGGYRDDGGYRGGGYGREGGYGGRGGKQSQY